MSLVNCLQRANKGKRVFTSAEIQELTRLAAQSDAASAVQKLLDEAIAEQAEVRSLILEAAPALGEKAEVKPVEAKAEAKPEAAPAPSEEVAAVEPAPVEEAKPEGVQNFGEVLPPSRRQKIAALDASLSDDDIEKRPLSEIWPLSANEAIEDKFAAAVAHAARESVPTKPRKGYKLDRWVQAVKTVRELSKLVVSGGVTPEQFKAKAGSSYAMDGFVSKVGLLNAIDRAQWKRIGDVRESPKAYIYEGGKQVLAPQVSVTIDGKHHWLEGSGSVADHLDKINELLGEAQQDKKMAFEVRGSGTKFFINKKGDSEYRHLMEFTTAEEAIKAKREQYDDLVKAWDSVKDRDNVTERDLRSDENKDRIGKDWREGKDISGDEFDAKFGFKGGEFGKWVSQGTGARERQWMLNRAYDALMDLAEIVGVPPRAISLNGTMGIAFGSRGSGWASAHFEPGNLVINLTKTRGAGALGHEWFHALDNYFSRMRRGGSEAAFNGNQKDYRDNNFITHHPEPMMVGKGPGYRTPMTRADLERRRAQNPNAGYFKAENWQVDPIHPDGVRPEVEERFADLVKALNEAPMTKRAAMIDKGTGYWSQMLERAARSFESYLLLRMQEKGQSNDYLANVTKFQDFKRDKGRYPYPTPDEIKPVADAFDALFAEVKTREDDAGNVAMFSRASGVAKDVANAWRILSENDEVFTYAKSDATDFADIASSTGAIFAEPEPGTVGADVERAWRIYPASGGQPDKSKRGHVIHYKDGKVELNVEKFTEGSAGSAAYAAVGNYAFNNGLQFAPDRFGMTQAAIERRLENLISLALKFGSTDFIRLSPAQLKAFKMKWRDGDTAFNTEQMLMASYNALASTFPEIKDYTYDLETGARKSDVGAVGRDEPGTEGIVARARAVGARAGERTISRAIFTNTFASEPTGKARRELVGRLGEGNARLLGDNALAKSLYSRNANTRLGIPMKDATAVAQAIREALPTAPQIIVHESLAQAPQKLQDAINAAGAANDVEAAYHDGAIHVFPQHMASVERMAFVVGHHEIRHHGLRSMLGPRLGPVLLGMHQGNAGLREAAQAKIDAGLATSRVDAIEEALADMPAEDLAALTGWDKIVTAVRQWLRNLAAKLRRTMPNLADAIDPMSWTDRDVAAMVMRAENVSRGGSGAFRTGGTVFSQDSDKPLTEAQFYRTYLQHKDIRGQRAGTAAQNAEAIMRDGFKSQAGAINVMPAYRGGQPINVAERAYAPRAGDTVYLVPRDAMDGDKVKTGWKPKPYEVLTITEDYASLYQEYLRAREEGGSGTMFSRTTAGTAKLTAQRETVKAVRQTIGDIFGSAGAKVSWWDKTLGTQYAKAQKFPTFKRVFDQVQQYLEDVSSLANEAADNAPSILPKLETWKDLKRMGLSDADATAIAAPIFTGTLTDEKVYSDAELKSQHKLNDAQIKLYREFMATVNTSLDQVVAADVVRLLGDKNPALQELAITDRAALREGVDAFLTDQIEQATDDPENQQALTELRESIREKYTKVDNLKAKGYAPLMRFGKYAVNVADPATGESLFFGLYESRGAANRMTRELGEDPQFKGKEITQGVLSAEQYKLFQAVPMESLEMFANAIGAEQSAVFQEYLKLAKNNRSALKRLIKRKGTAGFSEDVPRVLAAFTTSNARLASGAMNWTKAKEAIQDIRDGDIKDEAIKLVDEVQNPGERASLFRSMMFANFIGGSVASALVNVTQPITMTLPYLSQFGGLTKAGARLMAAGKMAASGRIDDLALKVALKRAEADGIVSPQEIHHLTSQAMGTWGTNPYLQKAAFIWGAPFSLAEQFNRRVTFIAAYQTAKAEGIDDPFGFAEKSVTETQGLYNKGNAPNLTRSAIGASALTFKQFSIHYLEWMGRMWKSGPEGKKAVGIALALLILAAGTDGLPGADDLDDLIDTLAQSMGYDLNVKRARREFVANTLGMGDEGADVLARGLSAMAGVPMDLSLRMSMGNLLPGTGILLRSNTDKSASLLEVAGPLGGLTKQYLEASQAALRGDVGSAIEKAAPVAIQNAIKGASMWATGEARDTKGAKVMEADGLDAAVKIVGFNPSSIARESQKLGMIRRSEQLAKNVEGEIAAAWARAIVDKDADGIAEARQQLADWNENNPEARIKITMQQLVQRAKKLRETRAQRFITSTSPERRRAVAEEIQ